MCNNKECADYFKSRHEYKRCFEEFRKKWKSYGKPGGFITLIKTSKEERQAIGGIIGKVFFEETLRFSFSEFEQGLQKTRFAPVDIKELLEEYFGETLISTKEQKKEDDDRRREFFDGICQYFEKNYGKGSDAFTWINKMISSKKYGYRILIREFEKQENDARLLAKNIGNALIKLNKMSEDEEDYPLAVFAAYITDNPHYFDRGTTAGLLFIHAICAVKEKELPESAHQWRKLLMQVLIVPDNISSIVHGYGLQLLTKEGRHPAYEAFCKRDEAYVITMENMKGITGVETTGERVYVVENEMVFGYLIQNLKEVNCTILCTSGQPRSVAQILFSYILECGFKIYYNGDIDPDGVCIADRLWKKFGENFYIWRMEPKDYEKSISKEKIGAIGRVKLENISNPLLRETAKCIRKRGLSAYQENMLKELLFDIGSKT